MITAEDELFLGADFEFQLSDQLGMDATQLLPGVLIILVIELHLFEQFASPHDTNGALILHPSILMAHRGLSQLELEAQQLTVLLLSNVRMQGLDGLGVKVV